ncbi:MAG: DUF6160 family protein [Oleispira sp.]|jgi:hypothetical protein
MTLIKIIIVPFCLLLSIHTVAELVPVDENNLANISGQAGISLDSTVDLTIGNISYQQRPTDSYFMLNDITARYSYVGATIDVTARGALRLGLPETLHIDEFSFGLYNSKTATIDINNPNDIQTYTIYADTLGNAYDGFTLNISGASLDNGSTTFTGDYVGSATLAGNRNTQLTIVEATDISISLTSEDDCTTFLFCDSEEDFAHIVIVDEDGNIVTQAGQAGTNNTSLNYSFDSPINNHFLMNATLTGTFKMGGAIEMFGAGDVAYKR